MMRFCFVFIPVFLFLYSCEIETEKAKPIVEILSPQEDGVYFTNDSVSIKLKISRMECDILYKFTKVEIDYDQNKTTKLSSYDYTWYTSDEDEGHHMINVTVYDDCSQSTSLKRQIHIKDWELPTVYTLSGSQVTESSVTIAGQIESDGGCPILERGFYLGAMKYKVESDSSYFEIEITGLQEAQYYYYSAYAINERGESVGETLDVQTNHKTCIVAIDLSPIPYQYENTDSTIISFYEVYEEDDCLYGYDWASTGVYYGTSPDPFNSGINLPLESNGPGTYFFQLDSLQPDTDYYVQAYFWGLRVEGESDEVVYRTTAVK